MNAMFESQGSGLQLLLEACVGHKQKQTYVTQSLFYLSLIFFLFLSWKVSCLSQQLHVHSIISAVPHGSVDGPVVFSLLPHGWILFFSISKWLVVLFCHSSLLPKFKSKIVGQLFQMLSYPSGGIFSFLFLLSICL